jgi:hypothetical protein
MLGRRGEGIHHFDIQVLQHFLPLHHRFFLSHVTLLPEGISPFHKPKDRMIIDVVL